ncbi:MAG TPA: hypothetical protein VHF22_11615 [Planctomycetota bacterium]|nr:hypothetical protein [Planctomycetota bacterium]
MIFAARRSLAALGLAVAITLGGAAALLAQEDGGTDINPDEVLASAKTNLEAKKYGKALQDLNLLVATVGKLRVESLKKTFADAPAGWTAEDAEGNSQAALLGVGLSVKRRYQKDPSSMDVELTADSPMLAMIAAAFTNPALVQGQEGKGFVTVKGRRGILEFHKDATNGELTFLLNNNTAMIKFTGTQVKKADLTEFAKSFDFDKMEKALQD